jgi:hypothetical protein
VTNTGSTGTASPDTVAVTPPRGLVPGRATGSGWTCVAHAQAESCTRLASLPAHATSTFLAAVRITAPVATVLTATAIVGPADVTPADNTTTDRVSVHTR